MANEKIVGIKLVVDVAETKKLDDATTKLGLSIQKVASMSSSSVEGFALKATEALHKEEQTLASLAGKYRLLSDEIDKYKFKSSTPTTVAHLAAETNSLTNLAKLYQERTKLIEEANSKGSKGAAQQAVEITSLTASINKLTSSYDALIKKTQAFKDANLNIGPGGKDAAYIPSAPKLNNSSYNYGTGATTPTATTLTTVSATRARELAANEALVAKALEETRKREQAALEAQAQFEETIAARRLQTERNFATNEEAIRANELARLRQDIQNHNATMQADLARRSQLRQEEIRLNNQVVDLTNSTRRTGANSLETLELQTAQNIVNIRQREAQQLQAIEDRILADVQRGVNRSAAFYNAQRTAVQNSANRRVEAAQQPVTNRQAELASTRNFITVEETLINQSIARQIAAARYGQSSIEVIRLDSAHRQEAIERNLQTQLASIQAAQRAGTLSQAQAQGQASQAFRTYQQDVLNSNAALREAESRQVNFQRTLGGTISRIFELTGAWRLAIAVQNTVLQGLKDIPNALIAFQQFEVTLNAIYGSSIGAKNMEFINNLADSAGQQVSILREAYQRFAPAAALAGANQAQVNKVFKDFTETSTVLHLSEQQVKSLYVALEQMYGKANVQSEEMKKQLGNVLPGAVEIGAKAWATYTDSADKSVRGFMKAMKENKVFAEEFVPVMAATYRKIFGGEDDSVFLDASTKLQSNLARLKNRYTDLSTAIGTDSEGMMNAVVRAVGTGVKGVTENLEVVKQSLLLLTATIVPRLAAATWGWVTATRAGAATLTSVTAGLGAIFSPITISAIVATSAVVKLTEVTEGYSTVYAKFQQVGQNTNYLSNLARLNETNLKTIEEENKELAKSGKAIDSVANSVDNAKRSWELHTKAIDFLNKQQEKSNSIFITYQGIHVKLGTIIGVVWDKVATFITNGVERIGNGMDKVTHFLQPLLDMFDNLEMKVVAAYKAMDGGSNGMSLDSSSYAERYTKELEAIKAARQAGKGTDESGIMAEAARRQQAQTDEAYRQYEEFKTILDNETKQQQVVSDQKKENGKNTIADLQAMEDNYWKEELRKVEAGNKKLASLTDQANEKIKQQIEERKLAYDQGHLGESNNYVKDAQDFKDYIEEIKILQGQELSNTELSLEKQKQALVEFSSKLPSSTKDGMDKFLKDYKQQIDTAADYIAVKTYYSNQKKPIPLTDPKYPGEYVNEDTGAHGTPEAMDKLVASLKEVEKQYKNNNKELGLTTGINQQIESLETKLQQTQTERLKQTNDGLKEQLDLAIQLHNLRNSELANPYKTPNFDSTEEVKKGVDSKYAAALVAAQKGVNNSIPGSDTLLNNLELAKQNDLWTENVKAGADYKKKLDDIKNSTLNLNQVSTTILGAIGGKYQKVLAVLKDYDTGLKQIKAAQAENQQNTKIEQNVKIDPNDSDALTKHNQLLKAYSAQAIELDNKETASKLGNMSLLAGSISQFFGKKTSLAKAANAIEVSLGVASMAMDKKSQLSALMTIPAKIAAGAAQMFSQSGWFGFAGVAAMVALMAGLGFSGIGGGSGGGGVPSVPESTGKGTVLGDSNKDSTALADSLQLLTDVGYKSYGELVKLNNNFTSIKNAIGSIVLQQAKGTLLQGTVAASTSGISNSAKLAQHLPAAILLGPAFAAIGFALQQAIEKIPVIGKLLKGINDFILGGLFGKTTTKVTAQGILTNMTSVSKVLQGFDVGMQEYQTIEKKTKSWFSSSTKIYDVLSPASKAASSTFNTLFSSIASTMKQLAESVNPQAVVQLYSAKFNAIKIDLKGLSAEKAGEKITKVFNAEMDKLATKVFKGIYDDLQQVGEGMFTTINRINIQREVLTPQLKKLNVTLPTDTVAATKFIDTLISFSSTADTASARLTETRDKLIAFYNATTPESSKNLGAVDNLGAGLSTFFLTVASDAKKAVLTAQENYSDSVAALQAASTPAGRKKLGKKADSTIEILSTIADTRKQELTTAESAISVTQTLYNSFFAKFKATGDFGTALKSMLTSVNMNTAAGKQEAQILLNLAEATNNYNSILANTKKSIQDNIDTISATIEPVTSLSDLMATLSNTTDINKQQTLVTKIQKQIMDGYNTQINSINSLKSTFTNLINYVKGLVIGQYSVLNPKEQLAEAKKQFEELAATAKDATDPTKQQAAIDKLQGASDTYLGIAKKYYSSTVDFVKIQQSVLATLNDVISLSGTNSEDATANAILATKSVAELAISQLTTLSTTLTDAAIKAMQESVKANVIEQGGTVTDTGVDANGTSTATVTPSGGTTAATTTASTLDTLFSTLYGAKAGSSLAKNTERQIKAYKHGGDTELQAEIQREEVKSHLAVLNKNKKLYKTEIADANALLKKLNSQISFKATGGFGQGLTMVGERGFELVDLPVGSKVHSNSQSQALMKQDTAETVDQLKQIVLQLSELNGRMDKIDRKTTLSPKARA